MKYFWAIQQSLVLSCALFWWGAISLGKLFLRRQARSTRRSEAGVSTQCRESTASTPSRCSASYGSATCSRRRPSSSTQPRTPLPNSRSSRLSTGSRRRWPVPADRRCRSATRHSCRNSCETSNSWPSRRRPTLTPQRLCPRASSKGWSWWTRRSRRSWLSCEIRVSSVWLLHVYIRVLKSHVLNHTMHNTRIHVRYKSQYGSKTTLISIVEEHAGCKLHLSEVDVLALSKKL